MRLYGYIQQMKVKRKKLNSRFTSVRPYLDFLIFASKILRISLEEVFTSRFALNYKDFGFCYLVGKMLFCIFSTKALRTSCEEVHI